MITEEMRQAILALKEKNLKIREIGKTLDLSRNTVRNVLRGKTPDLVCRENVTLEKHLPLIRDLHGRCRGNLVRVHELLWDRGIEIGYSTLTRVVRKQGVGSSAQKRAGSYVFTPGEEMQFDTSPHRVMLGERTGVCHCAALVLAHSRYLYIRYFFTFSRFETKAFLTEALTFMDGACSRCVIDNSSVVVARGSGREAEMAPEMEAFARHYGFTFLAHRVRHPDRKARVERPFAYIERNFLVGRSFLDLQDLNAQALLWCREVSNKKTKRSLGMSPEKAYILEKPFLQPLPPYVPPIYESLDRIVDTEGFVSLETNRYSVPDKLIGKTVEVQKHLERVKVYAGQNMVAEHERIIGKRDVRITAPGHHASLLRARRSEPCLEERSLLGESEVLDRYVAMLKQRSTGRGVLKLRRLLELKRTYPAEPFQTAVARAFEYGLFDLPRLESLIIKLVAGEYFNLDRGED